MSDGRKVVGEYTTGESPIGENLCLAPVFHSNQKSPSRFHVGARSQCRSTPVQLPVYFLCEVEPFFVCVSETWALGLGQPLERVWRWRLKQSNGQETLQRGQQGCPPDHLRPTETAGLQKGHPSRQQCQNQPHQSEFPLFFCIPLPL